MIVRSSTEILLESSINFQGALTLFGDSVFQLAASTLTLNSLQIIVDGVNTDPGIGGIATLNGTITAPSIAISGNVDANSLSGSGAGEMHLRQRRQRHAARQWRQRHARRRHRHRHDVRRHW